MIELYTWKTPIGQQVIILLEEADIAYQLHPIDISKNQQQEPAFLKLNPQGKIPVIIDTDGPNHQPIIIQESSVILQYLAEIAGLLLPQKDKWEILRWVAFQTSQIAAMFGEVYYYRYLAKEQQPLTLTRYLTEGNKLYACMNTHLAHRTYFTETFSIADISIFPWVARHEKHGIAITDYPAVQRWYEFVAQRPAVQKGMLLL